ncbi:hypothetical protein [Roseivirga sp. E12]|uniref:hypothetical protein n=1 Tax=Roseivirga sp. E12 TaxID=2819237 RepID=UPI001ABCB225|nr:hypothetical protein [Roseivirga sp. E12]MBO3697305.1 hypothetical protein [Roseivirga sp. E12]
MYELKGNDRVEELKNFPQSDIGAPLPTVLASENGLYVIYYLQNTPEGWDGSSVRIQTMSSEDQPIGIVEFKHCYAHYFGSPNDEAIEGHPLYSGGVGPYAVHEVHNSSWIAKHEEMNSVHPHHSKTAFLRDKRHFIMVFHDTTFECIANSYEIDYYRGSLNGAIESRVKKL